MNLRKLSCVFQIISSDRKYWRGLVVRAVEDFIVLFLGGTAVWAVCWLVGGIFKLLGVAG